MVEVNILMVTIGLQSHLNPMLRLAYRLVSKGIHITLATNDVGHHWMLNSDKVSITSTASNPKPPGISLVSFSDGLSPEFDRLNNVELFFSSIETIGSRNMSNLITDFAVENKKFSCIIFNPFMPWVPDVAAEHSIPCAVLWIQACTVFSVYYHFFKNPNLFPSFNNPNESIKLPGMPVLYVRDLPSFLFPSSPPIFWSVLSSFCQNIAKVKWVLANSFTELEEQIVNSMGCLLPIGPLVSPFLLGGEENTKMVSIDMWKADNSCLEWLDKKPDSSVIYISFGSIIGLSQKQMDSLAMGLKKSERPFLWVIKPADKNLERGIGELPSTFLEDTKGKGLMVTWCPQEKVLMHKAVGCFITHCGWNSVLETVVAGVPIIAYPDWTDQPTVAKYFVDVLKIGVRVKVEDEIASADEVERCIMEITTGPEAEVIKKRALELREAAKKAGADGGSSDQNIDRFLSEIVGCHSTGDDIEGNEDNENV